MSDDQAMSFFTIFVDGMQSAGKTTFIANLKHEVMSISLRRILPTPFEIEHLMDEGTIRRDSNDVFPYISMCGQYRARWYDFRIWMDKWLEHLLEQATGMPYYNCCLIMLDSTCHNLPYHAGYLLEDAQSLSIPYAIVANKQDLPDAQSPEAIRSILNIPEHIPVLPCIATERDSVKAVLVAVFNLLPQDDFVQQAIAKVEGL